MELTQAILLPQMRQVPPPAQRVPAAARIADTPCLERNHNSQRMLFVVVEKVLVNR